MKIYRAELKAHSSYCSPVQSDTLFGAFCWAYRYKYGLDELTRLLELYRSNNPPVIFSNGFIGELLPMPLINIQPWGDKYLSKQVKLQRYKLLKRAKRIQYITLDEFNNILSGNFKIKDFAELGGFTPEETEKTVITYRNIIDRVQGTASGSGESGGLFTQKESYPQGNVCIYLKIKDGWQEKTAEVLDLMCLLGIGGKKSTGKGSFRMERFYEFGSFAIPSDPDGFVVLSNYIPCKNDPKEGNYRTIVKYGKLDREFAASAKPFKKPLIMIKEGAIFRTENLSEFYGQIVENVSPYSNNIVHNGIAFVLPGKFFSSG